MQTHMLLWHYAAVSSPRDRMPRASGPGWLTLARQAWRRWHAPA